MTINISTILIPSVQLVVPVTFFALFCFLAYLSRKRFTSDVGFFQKYYCSSLMFVLMVVTFFLSTWLGASYWFHYTRMDIELFLLLMSLLSILSLHLPFEIMRFYVSSKLDNVYFFMIFNSLSVHVDASFFQKKETNDNATIESTLTEDEEETLLIERFVSLLLPALTPSVKEVTIASHVIDHRRREKMVKALMNYGAEIILKERERHREKKYSV
ncbi:hypothetical protein AV650_28930 (plasmid) [Serratia fonticola]|nr:hypothetical protein AV650_28930 [Serratia fonticola]